MDLYLKEVLVIVSDSKNESVEDECYFSQCFWVETEDLPSFLKMCYANNKYVKIELDYTKEAK